MIKSECYFSVKEENLQWLSTLVLNHCCSGDLPVLLVHHLRFFGSFENLEVLLKLYWKNSGYNEKKIRSKVRQFYFSDVKRLMLKKLRNTCLLEASPYLEDCKKYYDYGVNFFLDDIEVFYDEKPDHLISYKESILNILPNVQQYREMESNNKKKFEELSEVDSNGSNFDIGPPPDYSIADITEEEKEILKENEIWIKDNDEIMTDRYKKMIIKEFEYNDINHFNMPRLFSDDILEIMNDGEELQKVSSRYFQFLHGVKIFEKLGGKEINESFGKGMRYLNRRIGEIAGLKMALIPDEIWTIHSLKLEKIKLINEEFKIVLLDYLNGKINKEVYKKSELDLYYKKCLIMSEIKIMYTKYAYIQDLYLGRKTDYMLDFDLCGFIKVVKYYKEYKSKHSRMMEGRKITEYEGSFSPSINETKKLGRDYYTDEEARKAVLPFIKNKEDGYKNSVEKVKQKVGSEWVEEFIENFSENDVKILDEEFVRLKEDYNCLIRSRSKWDDMDKEYYYKLLQQIFLYDSDFLKYLPKDLKEGLKLNLDHLGESLSFINAMCSNKPINVLAGKTKKAKPEKSDLEKTGLDYAINLVKKLSKETDRKTTNVGNVKIKELGDSREMLIKWENSKNMAIDKVNSSVEDFAVIYQKLGDTVELTPEQLGFRNQNCTCHKKVDHKLYKNALLNGLNKYSSKRTEITKDIQNLEDRKKQNEDIIKRRDFYLNILSKQGIDSVEGVKNEKLDEWVSPKNVSKDNKEKAKLVGLETKNRFSALYDNKDNVDEANYFANKFLSNSENMNIVFDWKRYKENNKRVKKEIMEEEEKRGFVSPNRINKIKTRNGTLSIKKYNVTNIKEVLVDLYLCYINKIFPDYSYYKEIYRIRRCQSKFLINSLKQTLSQLIEKKKGITEGKRSVSYERN